jgi:hypothetical protein
MRGRITRLDADGNPTGESVDLDVLAATRRWVIPYPDDRMPDQLDVQVAMATNLIRRDANDARHRLGLEPRNYDHVEPGEP